MENTEFIVEFRIFLLFLQKLKNVLYRHFKLNINEKSVSVKNDS